MKSRSLSSRCVSCDFPNIAIRSFLSKVFMSLSESSYLLLYQHYFHPLLYFLVFDYIRRDGKAFFLYFNSSVSFSWQPFFVFRDWYETALILYTRILVLMYGLTNTLLRHFINLLLLSFCYILLFITWNTPTVTQISDLIYYWAVYDNLSTYTISFFKNRNLVLVFLEMPILFECFFF